MTSPLNSRSDEELSRGLAELRARFILPGILVLGLFGILGAVVAYWGAKTTLKDLDIPGAIAVMAGFTVGMIAGFPVVVFLFATDRRKAIEIASEQSARKERRAEIDRQHREDARLVREGKTSEARDKTLAGLIDDGKSCYLAFRTTFSSADEMRMPNDCCACCGKTGAIHTLRRLTLASTNLGSAKIKLPLCQLCKDQEVSAGRLPAPVASWRDEYLFVFPVNPRFLRAYFEHHGSKLLQVRFGKCDELNK